MKLMRDERVAPTNGWRQLGELLVERGATTRQTVQAALKRQRRDRRRIGELLLETGVREHDVIAAVGAQLGMAPLDLSSGTALADDAIHALDADFVRSHGILPLYVDDFGRLHVATSDPQDELLRQAIADQAGRPVVVELAGRAPIQQALDRHYTVLTKVDAAVQRALGDRAALMPVPQALPLRADAPVVQIVNLLLVQGLRDRASDIHLEPQADRLRVRFRVDGALRDIQSLPRELGPPLASRVKIMAQMDIVDRHRSQDGQIAMELDGRQMDVRVATMETIWGEKVVMRLLDRSRSLVPLVELGLQQEERERLQRLIKSPYGLMIVSGPTGAGKTTTLYAALNELDRTTRNITTIEDPVEYQFSDINQIQINRLAGTTFANGLRAILRQDPDVILVGEVRDVETAEIAIQSALTGHLVLCSLHAADAVGAIFRFLDMGIEPFLVTSAVIGVVAQRLVRTVCDRCKAEHAPRIDEIEFYRSVTGRDVPKHLYAGAGCVRCGRTGFYDRTGVFETLEMTDEIRERIVGHGTHGELRSLAVQNGMRTLQEAGCDAVNAGRTTIAEVMRTVYVI